MIVFFFNKIQLNLCSADCYIFLSTISHRDIVDRNVIVPERLGVDYTFCLLGFVISSNLSMTDEDWPFCFMVVFSDVGYYGESSFPHAC